MKDKGSSDDTATVASLPPPLPAPHKSQRMSLWVGVGFWLGGIIAAEFLTVLGSYRMYGSYLADVPLNNPSILPGYLVGRLIGDVLEGFVVGLVGYGILYAITKRSRN